MTREELKALGLTDEQIDKVMASHGKSINDIKEKADKVEGLESQVDDYKGQITERDTQLEELKNSVKDNEELTQKIADLEEQNKTTQSEYEEKLTQQTFNHKLDNTLSGAKVKNTKAIRALLDMDTIKLDGDTLKGLDDQLKGLKESDPYLFEEEKQEPTKPQIVTGGNPNGGNNGETDPFAAKLAKYN